MNGGDSSYRVELPEKGSLLIWHPKGYFKDTGHVAVIINVGEDFVDIAEQNVEDSVWPSNRNYSRRLSMKKDFREDGSLEKVTLSCTFSDTAILGWSTINLEQKYQYQDLPNCHASELERHTLEIPKEKLNVPWMPMGKEYQRLFVEKQGVDLSSSTSASYYTITGSGMAGLEAATDELHTLFLDATDYVINRPEEFAPLFCIPKQLWPKIRKSWFRKRNDVIAGRFDFALSPESDGGGGGVKVYEYNADSASCLLECGEVQGRWAEAAGLGSVGRDPGSELFQRLVQAWKSVKLEGPLHILCDSDAEEQYHAQYMKASVVNRISKVNVNILFLEIVRLKLLVLQR
jgi:glutathionylspermidine amidase/synthetase